MSERFLKYIQKLSPKEQKLFFGILDDIEHLRLEMYDIKKLKGFHDLYRLRKGKWRVLFQKQEHFGIVVDIDTRGNIYK